MIALVTLSSLGPSGCTSQGTFQPQAFIPGQMAFGPPGAARAFPLPPRWATALPPVPETALKTQAPMRDWTAIVIHHTATATGSVESIHEAHLKRKTKDGVAWQGIGYHFVIGNGNGMPDGAIESTFRWREQMQGAHAGNEEYNQRGIGIVLVGNFEETAPTPAQLAAVKSLVSRLKGQLKIPANRVVGHRDIRETACPGRYFPLAEVGAVPGQTVIAESVESLQPLQVAGSQRSEQP